MVHPIVCYNNSNKLESVEHNTCILFKCNQGWLHVSAFQEAIIMENNFIKYKTHIISILWDPMQLYKVIYR
jgi:hypothetical protein